MNYFSPKGGKRMWNERKFIVFESNLFRNCPSCSSVILFFISKILGSMVQVEQECGTCGHHRTWNSQPMTGSIPSGNLLLSAAILFNFCKEISNMCIEPFVLIKGLLPSKAVRFMEQLRVQTITSNNFFQHQKHYLHPSVF